MAACWSVMCAGAHALGADLWHRGCSGRAEVRGREGVDEGGRKTEGGGVGRDGSLMGDGSLSADMSRMQVRSQKAKNAAK